MAKTQFYTPDSSWAPIRRQLFNRAVSSAAQYGIKKIFHRPRHSETLNERVIERIINQPNGMKIRKFTLNFGKKRNEKDATGTILYYMNYSKFNDSGSTGLQLVSPYTAECLIPRYFTRTFILGSGTAAAGNETGPWNDEENYLFKGPGPSFQSISLFELNPNVNITGGGWLSSTQTNVNPMDIMVLKKIEETILLKNFTSISCDFQIYWFLCKEDTGKSPVNLWFDSLGEKRMAQPTVIGPTKTAKPEPGYSTEPQGFPGLEIFKEKLVKKFWKVVRVEAGVLDAGEECKFIIDINYHRGIKKSTIVAKVDNYISGLTLFPVVISNGGLVIYNPPISNVAPADTRTDYDAETSSRVTTSRIQLGSVVTRQYTFAPVSHAERYDYNVMSTQLLINSNAASFQHADNNQNIDTMEIIE